jgi:hypothetical protein
LREEALDDIVEHCPNKPISCARMARLERVKLQGE